MDRLVGRVAVVTGASSGIGAEVAQNLVRAGLIVAAVARRKDRLTSLKASLAAEGAKGRLEPVQADLSNVEEIRRVFQWVEDNLGGVTIVINNAATLINTPIHDTDIADMDNLVTTNVTAVMAGCKEAIASMKKHNIRDGHIINVNSVAGHVVINETRFPISLTAYTATKHAISALSKGLRFDVQKIEGFKIRVTSISPGCVNTAMVPDGIVDILPDPDMILQVQDVSAAVFFALACRPGVEITELTIQPTGEQY